MPNSQTFLLGGDLPVNRIGFGAMRLAANGFTGPARDPERGRTVLRAAVEAGVNHIDTAAFYASDDGSLSANAMIREALYPYPQDLVLATKVGPSRGADGHVHQQTAPDDIRRMVEQNLQELGRDSLDLVYLRIGMADLPHGESLAARFEVLAAMRQEGLIRHLGLSNVDAGHLAEARAIAPVAAVQNHFHAAKRDDADLLRECEAAGIAFVPFFPLGGGMGDIAEEQVTLVAKRHGVTVHQIALAWLLASSPVVLAIPGTGSPEHLAENMAAGRIRLTEEDMADLGAA
ncbi:aldo/keto reductase [Pseudarthrobacter chlorophenolicus]|uniref:aldo/keto reductase n=1 Tax=Pseudarthrobacter chlorophenolicus TaxID=85085 RepID=UPI0005F2BC33|nr:aldo/keto reductase [Pseudarthrobacter chlorophenolicus]